MRVTVVDYNSGNLQSVMQSLHAAADKAGLGISFKLSGDAEDIAAADRIVLPGVGSFADCAQNLRAIDGMEDALNDAVFKRAVPFLGICVGMQVMANSSSEGSESGLGWIDAHVDHLHALDQNLRLPHMGWNSIYRSSVNPILSYDPSDEFYFLHSYGYAQLPSHFNPSYTKYSSTFVASFAYNNILGVQFHPEKSHQSGHDLINRFCTYDFGPIG